MLLYSIKSSFNLIAHEAKITFGTHLTALTKQKIFRGKTNIKLHLGCGYAYKPRWVNVDISGKYDLFLDLRGTLPFDDLSATYILSEHFLEHLRYPDEVMTHLKECYRILAPHGVFRIGIPDSRWAIENYLQGPNSHWLKADKKYHWHSLSCVTPMDHLNYHFRQNGEHLYAYDFETVKRILQIAGFTHVHRSKFDPSIDTDVRKVGTLYVNSTK